MTGGAAPLAVLLFAAAIARAGSPPEPPTRVDVDGSTIRYTGRITTEANERVASLLAEHPRVQALAIESIGGEVGVGMDLGDLVLAKGLDVRAVGRGCASSCANYVFVSGRRKIVEPGAVIVWHGSMLQPMLEAQLEGVRHQIAQEAGPGRDADVEQGMARLRERMAALMARQHAFFAARRIDERITVLGHEQACSCVWTLDGAGMAAFGLQGLELPPGYPAIDEGLRARGLRLLQP